MQFSSGHVCDFLKWLCDCTHRGNLTRQAPLLHNLPHTGKNVLCEQIILLFETTPPQFIQYSHIKNSESAAGNELGKLMNRNLALTCDELKKFDPDLKTIVNTNSVFKFRKFLTQKDSTVRGHANIILSCNEFPEGATPAMLSRILPFNRSMQYENVNVNYNLPRINSIATVNPGDITINHFLATQILVDKIPKVHGVTGTEFIGLYKMVWNISDLFFYSLNEPTSTNKSPTMQKDINELIYKVQPSKYLIDNKIIEEFPMKYMTTINFDAALNKLLNSLRSRWPDIKNESIRTDILDRFKHYVVADKIYIRINE